MIALPDDEHPPVLHHAVWEITLACTLRCLHCGSRAGLARDAELDTSEALAVAHAMADLGAERVTLMGGEPLVRDDWETITAALVDRGVLVELVSNGVAIDEAMARRIARVGVHSVSLSVDGTRAVHERLRGRGTYATTMGAVGRLAAEGIPVGVITQINRLNLDTLHALYEELVAAEVGGWQLQIVEALGRTNDHDELLLDPEDLVAIEDFVVEVVEDGRLWTYGADNIGYMSRREPILRSGRLPATRCWLGCSAGVTTVGVTSDGRIRGCLSMPDVFDEGSVRSRSLHDIWHDPEAFRYNRHPIGKVLEGECASCAFARVCRAGCSSLAYTSTGTIGDNRFCLHRLARP